MLRTILTVSLLIHVACAAGLAAEFDVERGQVFESIKSLNSSSSDKLLAASDDVVLADGTTGFTIDLPIAATVSGKVYRIKKTDSTFGVVTIDPNSTQTVDGS